ncbi:MAG: hypothetical protein JXR65_01420 [Bacteroidales bacterium]|nr:hypothetical protein [Bacteroidales bacterium]
MKNILLLAVFIFSTFIVKAQEEVKTDLEIANELFKTEVPSVQEALNKMGLTFQVIKSRSGKTSVFIEGRKNNMKKWVIETKRGTKRGFKKVVLVMVEYRMDNGGDFFDLRRYGDPPKKAYISDRKVKYKKSEGRKISTLEVTAK